MRLAIRLARAFDPDADEVAVRQAEARKRRAEFQLIAAAQPLFEFFKSRYAWRPFAPLAKCLKSLSRAHGKNHIVYKYLDLGGDPSFPVANG